MKININKFKKLALAGTITLSTVTGGYLYITDPGNLKDNTNNKIGFDDINPFMNYKVKNNNFVVMNVGNHEKLGISNQNNKIKYCNKFDISLGIVVNTNFNKENEVYDDVELIKGIIRDYKIDFPVYINIDDIITNNDLNVDMKTKLLKDFLEKCSSNNIYVGVYGSDTNLVRLKKYCNIKEYDAYVVMDSNNIKYDGSYSIYKDLDGNIKCMKDIKKIISEKKLNDASKFQGDGAYIVKENDDITDIAMKYGLSVNELLNFNKIKEIKEGTVLRIPGVINNVVNDGKVNFKEVNNPLKGIDVSYCQGDNTNFDKLEKNCDFVIVRCSQGKNLDSCFEYNTKNCAENNIPVGIYCFNDYLGIDYKNHDQFIQVQKEQADYVIKNLKNKKIDYPVYLDIETRGNLKDSFNNEDIKDMLKIWVDKMNEAGYTPGLYSNMSSLEYIKTCTNLDNLQLWIAGSSQYLGEKDSIDYKDVKEEPQEYNYNNNKYRVPMRQVTDSAINSGTGNKLGHVDVNYSYIDYSKKERVNNSLEYYFDIKEFDRKDYKNTMLLSSLGLIMIPGIILFKKKGKIKIKK